MFSSTSTMSSLHRPPQQSLSNTSPIFLHDLLRPFGFTDVAARGEAGEIGLDVEHGRAVDGVEAFHFQRMTRNHHDAAHRDADAVGTVLAALREDADLRPVGASARMARAFDDLVVLHAVEDVDDLRMGEF